MPLCVFNICYFKLTLPLDDFDVGGDGSVQLLQAAAAANHAQAIVMGLFRNGLSFELECTGMGLFQNGLSFELD